MIRPRSTRMQKLMAYYRKRVRDWKRCKVCIPCLAWGLIHKCEDNHHIRGKLTTLLIDERFWLPICRHTHEWIKDHPDTARLRGWLCEKGLWNHAPKDAETERLKALIAEITK